MNNILKEISSESIDFYIEQNLDDFYTKSSRHSNFISHIEEKISWVLAKNAEWPMYIFRTDFEDLDLYKEINYVKQLIRENEAPNGWTVGPLTIHKNLGNILERFGFSNVYQQADMAINLKDLKDQSEDRSNLKVDMINNKDSLNKWVEVVSLAFGLKVDIELLEYLFLEPEAKFYIGSYGRKPVSTLLLYCSSGVAGLHAVSKKYPFFLYFYYLFILIW